MSEKNGLGPFFKVCWINTAEDDHYVGIVGSYEFCGNTLKILLTRMARVHLINKEDLTKEEWIPLHHFECKPFEFTGCRVLTNKKPQNISTVISSKGDSIVASKDESSIQEVEEILAKKV